MGTAVLLITSTAVEAKNPAQKFARGAINIVTSPLEIPKQTRVYWKKGAEKTPHILVWVMSGIVKGVVETTKRFASGTWDVISFPVSIPADYEALLKPDYVF